MRIRYLESKPFHTIRYRSAGPGVGARHMTLAVLRAVVDTLPQEIEALIATSDLQGWEDIWGREPRLLGHALAEDLEVLASLGEIPTAHRTGVLLAGDLYARPGAEQRGGKGDVREIWRAFASRFRWVCGVPGNHDRFGEDHEELAAFSREPGIILIDGTVVEVDGLRIAGLGGVIGNPARPYRRSTESFLIAIEEMLKASPDILLMHEGPDIPGEGEDRHPEIRRAASQAKDLLVIRGHHHWSNPLVDLSPEVQILNVDALAVVMVRDGRLHSNSSS